MTKKITITVPDGHHHDPNCPHCFEPLGAKLAELYPDDDPHALGGEHRCPYCDSPIYVGVYRPVPVFNVTVPPEHVGVTHLSAWRR